jgi:hypothetical protein
MAILPVLVSNTHNGGPGSLLSVHVPVVVNGRCRSGRLCASVIRVEVIGSKSGWAELSGRVVLVAHFVLGHG